MKNQKKKKKKKKKKKIINMVNLAILLNLGQKLKESLPYLR